LHTYFMNLNRQVIPATSQLLVIDNAGHTSGF